MRRDYGARLSQSRYIAFLDSDDIWPPNYLSSSFESIRSLNFPSNFFSCSPYEYVWSDGRRLLRYSPFSQINLFLLCLGNWIGNSTVVVSRSLILSAGGYSSLLKRNDYATWLRIVRQVPCLVIQAPPVRINRLPNSLSSRKLGLLRFQYLCFREASFPRPISF